jgi:hypothetical protein
MSFLFRLRCLNLFIKVFFPDRHRLDTPMGSIPVRRFESAAVQARRSESAAVQARRFLRPPGGIPDFVDDLTEEEIGACNAAFRDAWAEALDDPDTLANARGFLEATYHLK